MKREDFKQVQTLRESGYSYSEIATVLGVPKNSIKSYCNRFGIRLGSGAPPDDVDGALRCRQCGLVIEKKRSAAIKRFCSSECRMRWWNAHRDHATSKTARIVKKHFAVMPVIIESIAAMSATSQIGLGGELLMTNDQFERERRYRVAISVAAGMLKQGLISEDEYGIINETMIEKYKPLFGGLMR